MNAPSSPEPRPAAALPSAEPARCGFARSDGRRCRMARAAHHASLCVFHARKERQEEQAAQNAERELLTLTDGIVTRADLHRSLRKLFALVVQRRVSPADAAVLAQLAELILQTVPGAVPAARPARVPPPWQHMLGPFGVGDDPAEADEDDEEDETGEAELAGLFPAQPGAPAAGGALDLAELATMLFTAGPPSRRGLPLGPGTARETRASIQTERNE